MNDARVSRFPLTLTQFLVGLAILVGFFIAFGLNQNATELQNVQESEGVFQAEVNAQMTISAELEATYAYVQSDAYVEDFNRGEANQISAGEVRVVPLIEQATPRPTEPPPPPPDPAALARPWQMWWYLLTDAEAPTNNDAPAVPTVSE